MRAFLKRYRELIIVGTLLVFPIAVWLTHAKHGRDLSALDRVVLTATAPIERAVNGVAFAIIDTVEDFTNRQEVHAENLELRRRVIRLEGEVAALGEMRMENARLRETLG
ncbi:MAG: rod shape-determining protein MreC, partial [Myxococcaceae bacterium]|nr:rod shape-determining protein MreC [Myxococcaceae bacterium]